MTREAERLAERLWQEARLLLDGDRRPPRPGLIVLSGPPLVGKTTLARALAAATEAPLLHVENDAVREHVAEALGRPAPAYDDKENQLTYATARGLVRRASAWGAHAIHDATNLDRESRAQDLATAAVAGGQLTLLFLQVPEAIHQARAEAADPDQQRAYRKLGDRQPDPEAGRHTAITVDTSRALEDVLEDLLADPRLAWL